MGRFGTLKLKRDQRSNSYKHSKNADFLGNNSLFIMCGRYSVILKAKGESKAAKLLARHLQGKHYNAAPSQQLPVVTNAPPDTLQFFSWPLQFLMHYSTLLP